MWIEMTNTDSDGNPVTRRLKNGHTNGEFVDVTESGKANVTNEVGERLIERGDARVPSEATADADAAAGGVVDGEADDATDDTGDT